jgi:hypothetical protein
VKPSPATIRKRITRASREPQADLLFSAERSHGRREKALLGARRDRPIQTGWGLLFDGPRLQVGDYPVDVMGQPEPITEKFWKRID